MRVEGKAHLEKLSAPVLFVANHVSVADHALVLAGLPPRLRHKLAIAMEGELLRDWLRPPAGASLLSRLGRLGQYVLVNLFFHVFRCPNKAAFGGASLTRASVWIAERRAIFPEGVRHRAIRCVGQFKVGIGVLAQELKVPVVPVKLVGLYELKQRGRRFAPPGIVRVIFDKPMTFGSDMQATEIAQGWNAASPRLMSASCFSH